MAAKKPKVGRPEDASDKCLVAALRANGDRVSEAEVKKHRERIKKIIAENERFKNNPDYENNLREQIKLETNFAKQEAMKKKVQAILHFQAQQELRKFSEAFGDNIGDSFEAVITGAINTPYKGAKDGVGGLIVANQIRYYGPMAKELAEAGLFPYVRNASAERDRELRLALAEVNGEKTNAKISKEAMQAAKIINKVMKQSVYERNLKGAFINEFRGYMTTQVHDPELIRKAGFDKWLEFTKDKVNWAKMNVSGMALPDLQKQIYNELALGNILSPDGDGYRPNNLAEQISKSRAILFNSAADAVDYHQTFGHGNFMSNVHSYLSSAAADLAMLQRLGPMPDKALADFRNYLIETAKSKSDGTPKSALNLQKQIQKIDYATTTLWAHVTGRLSQPASAAWHRNGYFIRGVNTLSDLGGAALSSVTDTVNAAAQLRYGGVHPMKALFNAFTGGFSVFNESKRRQIAYQLSMAFEAPLNTAASGFSKRDTVISGTSKLLNLFFNFNMQNAWGQFMRTGMSTAYSSHLASMADRAMTDLDEDVVRVLRLANIDGQEWDIARRSVQEIEGDKFLTAIGIEKMPSNEFGSGLAGERKKLELLQKVHNLFGFMVGGGYLTPDARSRAQAVFGTKSGTFAGEAVRYFMQYKSFVVAFTNQAMGRELYGRDVIDDFGKVIKRQGMAGAAWNMGQLFAGMTVMGYFAMSLKDIAKNREPRDPSDPKVIYQAMLQGGGLGIFGDFLSSAETRYGNTLASTIAGPTIANVEDITDAIMAVKGYALEGESPETAKARALGIIKNNMPFVNLFYTKELLNWYMLYPLQESLNPGFVAKMEAKMMRENNQRFLLEPPQ